MTREETYNKTKELIKESDLLGYIDKKVQGLINSGAVNCEEFENDFILPKLLLCAALKEAHEQYKPFTYEGRKQLKNLEHF